MKTSFDQSTDFSGREIYQYLKNTEVPEYVKQAEFDDFETLGELPKEAFADSMRRVYPINTAARVFVSNVYFTEKKAELEETLGSAYTDSIDAKIKAAAALLDITEDLQKYTAESNVKQAADYTQKYVSDITLADDEIGLFPYKTAADLDVAGKTFVANMKRFPIEWRFSVSEGFMKAAEEEGLEEVPDLIAKYAGQGHFYTTPEHVVAELKRRSSFLKKAENKKIYLEDLTKVATEMDDIEDVRKIAEVCYLIETNEQLLDNYKTATVLGDPVDMFFNLSVEKVASMLDVLDAAGATYKVADLQAVGKDVYKEAFGCEVDLLDKQAVEDLISTAPRSDFQLFRELSGIQPV
jgi:tRNA-binding EMAP/Myf-like protein